MNEHIYIDTDQDFRAFLGRLKERAVRDIALDIEGEFNLHVYGERFCLLQVTDGSEDVAIDPFGVSGDLLKELLENRDLLKITYDSASDRSLMAKSHGIVMNSILDLRPAVDLLEFPKQGLSAVLADALGVEEAGSKKKFQQYNWTRRPIDPAAVQYALQDVRHLFPLKGVLLRRLAERGQLEAFFLENLKRQDRPPELNRKPGIFRSGRHARLTKSQKTAFEAIYDIRERYARDLDLPPNTVLSNNDLFSLVQGALSPVELPGNRRVPAATLEALKREIREYQDGRI